ncbi:hypothetical protein L1987_15762 [Smallanthus sonchifolius]|uniref:Uncharacterized protein n=1 Tax=Smallanthus sonchifolius TaxID=185202 RepID=A0ACB9J6Z2_9ASTR|nr:hypothetical protein L1987_15762 [Smallanthus sonchifolius]
MADRGWKVSYKGDKWAFEKLKVFVVPHSHNDPRWKLSIMIDGLGVFSIQFVETLSKVGISSTTALKIAKRPESARKLILRLAHYQIPRPMMPADGTEELEKYIQQDSLLYDVANSGGNLVQVQTSRMPEMLAMHHDIPPDLQVVGNKLKDICKISNTSLET